MNARHPPAGSDRRFDFIDVTLRDAHQCLWSTRMTTAMMTPILGTLDRVGYAYINILGGAVFDVCVRYLQENPWERVGLLCEPPRHAVRRADARAEPVHVRALSRRHRRAQLARAGAPRHRGADRLRRAQRQPQHRLVGAFGHEAGMKVNAMMTYTLSPGAHRCLLRRARARARRARAPISSRSRTRPACSRRSAAARSSRRSSRPPARFPLQLHSHCQSGLAPEVYEIAMRDRLSPRLHGGRAARERRIAARDRGHRCRARRARLRSLRHRRPSARRGRPATSLAAEREGKPRGQVAKVRSGALRASGAGRHDLQPALRSSQTMQHGASPARDTGGSRAGAA